MGNSALVVDVSNQAAPSVETKLGSPAYQTELPGTNRTSMQEQLADQAKIGEIVQGLETSTAIQVRALLSNTELANSLDKNGKSLLDNLHNLATSVNLAGPLVARRQELIESAIQLLTPSEINEGLHATCVPTSALWAMSKNEPAEVMRIMKELSISGQSSLRSGDRIYFRDEFAKRDFSSEGSEMLNDPGNIYGVKGRGLAEAIVTSSLMAMVNESYDSKTDKSVVRTGGQTIEYSGVTDQGFVRTMSATSGKEHTIYAGKGDSVKEKSEDIMNLISDRASQEDLTFVSLLWDSAGVHTAHCVTVTEIDLERGRVYFRNPFGKIDAQAGTELGYPPRISEDPEAGIESMSISDFSNRIRMAVVEKSSRTSGAESVDERMNVIRGMVAERGVALPTSLPSDQIFHDATPILEDGVQKPVAAYTRKTDELRLDLPVVAQPEAFHAVEDGRTDLKRGIAVDATVTLGAESKRKKDDGLISQE